MRKIKLGEIASYINGYAFKPSDWDEEGLPIIRIQDLTGNSYQMNRYSGQYPSKIEINNGDVLISWSASLGVYEWNHGKALLNQHIFKVVFDKVEIDKKYFIYAIEHSLAEMESKTHGATMKHIVKKDFDNTEIPYPSIEEQCMIAAHIGEVVALIELRTEQLKKLDELVKSRFIEMFGDLKTNPYHWECKSLTDVATIDTVMVTDYEKYANYPHIGIDSIEKNTGRLFGYRTIAEDKVISGKYLFTPKHIIYSKIRPNLNKVAMPDFEGLCSADAYPILPNENICLRIYLGYVMRSEFFLEYILPFSRRANMPKVNKEQLSGFILPIPNIDVQQRFAAFVEQIDKSKYHGDFTYRMEVAA